MRRLFVLVLACLLAVAGAPLALAHDAPTLRVTVRREGKAVRVRVEADAATWALAAAPREAAAARAVAIEDDAGRGLVATAALDGESVVVVADPSTGLWAATGPAGDEPLVRLSLFGTDAPGEAVVSIEEAGAARLVRVELPGSVRAPAGDAPAAASPTVDAVSFLAWGVEHVLSGWDHLAFLLTLLVVARGVRDAVKVATAFTLAHSVTLSLAAFDVLRLPAQPVEVAIALSIVVAAAANVLRPNSRGRTLVAFGFGLVHGLGFSSVLGEILGSAVGSRALAVAAFNGGVEVGQAAAICAVLPVLLAWRRRAPAGYARLGLRGLSLAAGAAGLFWLVTRAQGLFGHGQLA